MRREMGGAVVRGFQQLLEPGTVAGLTEREVLARFVESGDAVAFEAIVKRHGPMVFTVCRQLLGDPNDIDDAFQATFLILIRKAGTLRQPDRLGPWLYGVAYKVAHRARARPQPRQLAEDSAAAPGDCPIEERERLEAIHHEIDRLPEKYRLPIVLCCLEGLSHHEAARRLGWPVGTVHGRLSRGREQLMSRLERRDITWRTRAVEALVVLQPSTDVFPETLQRATVALLTGPVNARLQSLVNGAVMAMLTSKLKMLALSLAVAAIGVVSATSVLLAYQQPAPEKAAVAQDGGAATTEPTKQSAVREFAKSSARLPAESFEPSNERAWEELDQLEVKAELLEIDVSNQKDTVIQLKTILIGLASREDQPGASKERIVEARKLMDEEVARKTKELVAATDTYEKNRIELGRLKRRIHRMSDALGLPGSYLPNPSEAALGAKLDRVEQKIDRLLESQPAKPRR